MTVAEHMVAQIVSLCVLAASFVVLIWQHLRDQPASQPAGETIEQPPAVGVAIVEHATPAQAGAWRLDAVIDSDRRSTRRQGANK